MKLTQWHVYPQFKGERAHNTESADCWCEPRIEHHEGAVIVIHERWEER